MRKTQTEIYIARLQRMVDSRRAKLRGCYVPGRSIPDLSDRLPDAEPLFLDGLAVWDARPRGEARHRFAYERAKAQILNIFAGLEPHSVVVLNFSQVADRDGHGPLDVFAPEDNVLGAGEQDDRPADLYAPEAVARRQRLEVQEARAEIRWRLAEFDEHLRRVLDPTLFERWCQRRDWPLERVARFEGVTTRTVINREKALMATVQREWAEWSDGAPLPPEWARRHRHAAA